MGSGGTLNLGNTFALATNAANITVRGNGNFIGLGSIATNSGSLALLDGADLTTNAPAFTNSGELTLSAGSVLTAPGTFTQTASASTTFQIGAHPGKLAVTGAATLAGTANFTIAEDYEHTANEVITIANYALRTGISLGRTQIFDPVAGATSYILNSLASAADLATQTVSTPPGTNAGADISISYTVKNVSTNSSMTSKWTDAIYLSLDDKLDGSDILLTRVNHKGAVAAVATYTENVTVPLIGAIPANYRILVTADSQGRVADPDRANNTLASAGTFALATPSLTAGRMCIFKSRCPRARRLPSRFAARSRAKRRFSKRSAPCRRAARSARARSRSRAPCSASSGTRARRALNYVHGREAAVAGQTFTFTVSGLGFDLAGLDLNHGSNASNVTTTLLGSQFTPDTTFTLKQGATTRAATPTYFSDAKTVSATFDLSGLAVGSYDVVANNGVASDTLAGAFTVDNSSAGKLLYSYSSPRYIRPPFGESTVLTITYKNTGGTDIDAPLFTLLAKVTITDGFGHATQMSQTYQGQTARLVQPDGSTVSTEFDSAGRLLSTTDPCGLTSKSIVDASGLIEGSICAG